MNCSVFLWDQIRMLFPANVVACYIYCNNHLAMHCSSLIYNDIILFSCQDCGNAIHFSEKNEKAITVFLIKPPAGPFTNKGGGDVFPLQGS